MAGYDPLAFLHTPSSVVFFKNNSHHIRHLLGILQWSQKHANYMVSPLFPAPSFLVSSMFTSLQRHWASPGSANQAHISSPRTWECGPVCQSHPHLRTHVVPHLAPSYLMLKRSLRLWFPPQALAKWSGTQKALSEHGERREDTGREGRGMVGE